MNRASPTRTAAVKLSGAASRTTSRAMAKAGWAGKMMRPGTLAENSVIHALHGTSICLIIAAALLTFVYGNERMDLAFAVQHQGQLIPLQAMDQPNTSSEAVINWSRMAVGEIFTYNFNDIVPRFNAASRFFTEIGWNSFRSAFQEQSLLATTQSQRQFVTTLPSGNAVIAEEGLVKNRYTWNVQIETVTSIYTGSAVVQNGAMAMKVERIPTRRSSAGYPFGIVQITQ